MPRISGLPQEVTALAATAFCVALGFGIVISAIPLQDAGGVSLVWIGILFVGFVLLFTDGVVNWNLPLILTSAVSISATAALLVDPVLQAVAGWSLGTLSRPPVEEGAQTG